MNHSIVQVIAGSLFAVMACTANAGLFGSGSSEGATEECFKKHSQAWCALDAANLSKGVKDARKEEVLRALEKGANRGISAETVIDLAMFGATAAGVFTPAPGFTSTTEAVMVLLNAFFPSRPQIDSQNKIFGWMPYEMAGNPDQARIKLHAMLLEATRAALSEYKFEDATLPVPKDENTYSLDRQEHRAIILKGADCDKASCSLLQTRSSAYEYVHFTLPKEGTAPTWLGGFKAWVFDMGASPNILELRVNGDYVSQRYAQKLSSNLPAWIFISVTAQGKFAGMGTINRGQPIPLLYQQGKPLALIFPEFDLQQQGGEKRASAAAEMTLANEGQK